MSRSAARRWPSTFANWLGCRELRRRTSDRADVVARPIRGWAGGRADGVHREPVVRPAAVARRRRRIRGACPRPRPLRDHQSGAKANPIIAALDQVAAELGAGSFVFAESDEDIHTAVERRVTELAGPTGAKLHTGRSRNDQSATDVRLWMKRELVDDRPADRGPAVGAARQGRAGRRRLLARATRTCSALSRCCSRTTSSRTGGRSVATWSG